MNVLILIIENFIGSGSLEWPSYKNVVAAKFHDSNFTSFISYDKEFTLIYKNVSKIV